MTLGVGKGAWGWVQSPVANDLVNHAYVMKPPKEEKQKDWVGEHLEVGENITPGAPGPSHIPFPMHL